MSEQYVSKGDRAALAWLLRRYARPFAKEILLIVVITLCSNALTLLNPAIMAAALAALTGVQTAAAGVSGSFNLNSLGARVIETLLSPFSAQPTALLLVIAAAYLVQSLGVSVLEYTASLLTLKVRTAVSRLVQLDVIRHLLSLSLNFFHRQKSGELLSRITQDAVSTGQGIGPLVRSLLHHTIQLVGYGAYLLGTNVWLTLDATAIIAFHFLLTQVLKRPMRRLSRGLYDAQADCSTELQESFLMVRVAKTFGAEQFQEEKLERALDRVVTSQLRHGRVGELEAPVRRALDALAGLAIFLVAATQLRSGSLTISGLLLYVYVGRLMMTPANHMATNYLWLQTLLASFGRISELLTERPDVTDGDIDKNEFTQSIVLSGVSFSYGQGPAVEDVSLEIPKGRMVALVGPSGGGKSTLADLILRLYDPTDGRILIDEIDIRSLKVHGYRRLFGVVPQESLLFHDTIAENIRYGRHQMSHLDIERAAHMANADQFITMLPHGYETMVGDRGVRLSGGERQRIAIARAVVDRPQILVLDEATSALDSASERQVQLAIDQVTKEATAIIIAHRLSTILRADHIVVMDGGRILDQGRHEALLARCTLYQDHCRLQFQLGEAALSQPSREEGEELPRLTEALPAIDGGIAL